MIKELNLGVAEWSALIFVGVWLLNFCTCWSYGRLERLLKSADNKAIDDGNERPSLSIIITAHNQAPELQRNLPLLLEQEYAGVFEVIVVNDNSTDETEELLKQLEKRYLNLYHTFTPSSAIYISHKKVSLTLGIKAARYDWLVFTEANCEPQSNQWLQYLSAHFVDGVDIVLGYANYKAKRTPFAQSIMFDRFYHQSYYLQKAFDGKAYRGSGCNMAYRKSLFVNNKGFSNYANLTSGEDALFVNETATKSNIRVEIRPEAVIRQDLPATRKLWRQEKLFYMETRRYFHHKLRSRMAFNVRMFCLFLLYPALLAALGINIFCQKWIYVGAIAGLYLLYRIIKTMRFTRDAKNMNERPHRVLFPYYELSVPLRNVRYLLMHKFHHREFYRKR